MFAVPDLTLAVLFLRFRDYPTIQLDGPASTPPVRRTLAELFRARSGIARSAVRCS